jgi:hypothetical protein
MFGPGATPDIFIGIFKDFAANLHPVRGSLHFFAKSGGRAKFNTFHTTIA